MLAASYKSLWLSVTTSIIPVLDEFVFLLIINNDENTQDIVNQNFETFYIPAPRGEILDLNGNKLAESILEPYLFLNQKKINEENIR